MVIAHHKAHQRGYAKEDEANFVGYVICINSTDPPVRYSGYLYGLKVLEVLSKGMWIATTTCFRASMTARGPTCEARSEFWEG